MMDDKLRHMLNELTQKTFGFDFEGWVGGGYFEGDYIPYSLVCDGKIVSNVSANRMHFVQNGIPKDYIQIGTVMTDPDHRNQGLAAKLMRHVIAEYENDSDGIYLFGDLSAAGFYGKMGFKIENQYRYFVREGCFDRDKKEFFKAVKDMPEEVKEHYLELVRNSAGYSSFEQINRYGLQMFYTADLDTVFYDEDMDHFIVLDEDGDTVLQSVLSEEKAALKDVIARITVSGNRLRLGFTPQESDRDICLYEEYDGGEDYRLFYRGEGIGSIEKDKLYFPDLSHA